MKTEIKLEIISTYQFAIKSGYPEIKRSYLTYDALKNGDHIWGEYGSEEEGTAQGPWIDEEGLEILKENKVFEVIFQPPQYPIEFSGEEITILSQALKRYMENAYTQYGESSPATKSIAKRNENFRFFEIMRLTNSDLDYLQGCLQVFGENNINPQIGELFTKLGKVIKPKIERLYSLGKAE